LTFSKDLAFSSMEVVLKSVVVSISGVDNVEMED